jgi:hypothetical protein
MRTMLRILAIPAFLLCGSVAVAQSPPPKPADAPPATESKSLGAKSSGTTGGGSASSTGGSGSSSSFGIAAKKPEPGSLEEMLDNALRNNPDIRAAEAKVHDAEAESNRVRNNVIAKVVQLRNDIELAKKMLVHAQEIEKNEKNEMHKPGGRGPASTTMTAVLMAAAKVDTQKAEVARLEADLKAMLGSYARIKSGADVSVVTGAQGLDPFRGGTSGPLAPYGFTGTLSGFIGSSAGSGNAVIGSGTITFVQAPMAERIKNALEKPIQLAEIKEAPITDVVNLLSRKVGDEFMFRVLATEVGNAKLSLAKAEMPLGAWLQMVEDSVPGLRFVVRDYGILATSTASVPEGAMTVQQFWKQQEKAKPPAPKTGAGSPPAPNKP